MLTHAKRVLIAQKWDPHGYITSASNPADEYCIWRDGIGADWRGDELTLADFEAYIESLKEGA